MTVSNELLDSLLADYKKPEDVDAIGLVINQLNSICPFSTRGFH